MTGTPSAASMLGKWTGTSLTVRIVTGLVIGVLIGLFLGEQALAFRGMANAYIGLMQMTVLPYLVVALLLGLGRLSSSEAWTLARYGGVTLLAFWGLTLAVVGLMPTTFPEFESASFFSSSLLQPHEPVSFVELYIPSNPFNSLANNIVPAVTLFSACLGIALIGVEGKERFLDPLDAVMKALGRLTRFVIELTPLGVIPISAVAAGTLSPNDLSRLEVYFVAFLVSALLLGVVLLPLLVSTVTPIRYREIVGTGSDAVITAFVTSNVFVVLPMISEACDRLAERHGVSPEGTKSVPEIVVPIAFNFPTAGKLLTLLFVPFAAWLTGRPLGAGEYPGLMVTGLFSYFAKAQVALPFLMDLVEVPHDLFQLYIPTTLLNGKIDSAVGAMSLVAFSVITAAAMAGRLRVTARGLGRFAVVAVAAVGLGLVATAALLSTLVDTRYTKDEMLKSMHLSRSEVPARVLDELPADDERWSGMTALERIRARGSIRIGFYPERLPFTFFNASGQLVGFDVEMLAQMSQDLGFDLEFVPVRMDDFDGLLESGAIDLVPSVPYTHHWVRRVRLSEPYTNETIGLLVRDSRRHEFATPEAIAEHGSLRIGIPGNADLYEDYVQKMLGSTPYTLVDVGGWKQYFDEGDGRVDAVVGMAEVATAWSLIHPDFSVVIPTGVVIQRPMGFAMAPGEEGLSVLVDDWVVLQKARGNVDRAYDYWILGKGAEPRARRWSIGHHVLGWID